MSSVYNFDETALFYAQVTRRTISKTPLSGQKDDKTRITIAFACNADGSHKHKLFLLDMQLNLAVLKGKQVIIYVVFI